MAAAVITVTRAPGSPREVKMGNVRTKWWDITADTGDYATGGFTLTAAQLGVRSIIFFDVGSAATEGTAGANAQIIGVTYASNFQSVTVQVYESAASGAPPLEKTAEAYPANFTFRARVEGTI